MDKCKEEGKVPLVRKQFVEIFESKKLGLYQPKKDQCDTFLEYKHEHIIDVYAVHQERKKERRDLKNADKEAAQKELKLAYTMDSVCQAGSHA